MGNSRDLSHCPSTYLLGYGFRAVRRGNGDTKERERERNTKGRQEEEDMSFK